MKIKVYSSWFSTLLLNQYFNIQTDNITWIYFSRTLIERFHTMKAQTKMIESAFKMKHLLDHGCMIEEDWYLSPLNIFFLKTSIHTFYFFLYVNESEWFWINKSVIRFLTHLNYQNTSKIITFTLFYILPDLLSFIFPVACEIDLKYLLLEHNLLYFSQFIEFWLWLEGS